MRIAHATDIHWFTPPTMRDFAPKRVIGTLNLYVRGRRHQFDEAVQRELVAHICRLAPDAALITGDLTAQALPSEFAKAHAALAPLLDAIPTVVLPGNHDVYTPGSVRDRAFAQTFGAHAGPRGPSGLVRRDVGPITILGLDPNRPTWVTAAGRVPDAQLQALAAELRDPGLDGRPIVLGIHYPVVNRRGSLYDAPSHGLVNAGALVDVLADAPRRPALIACGHVHHGFRAALTLPDGHAIPVVNCGSSGQAHLPDRGWAASMAVYDVRDGAPVGFERWIHDGRQFRPEPGGAFASGY